MAVTQQNVVPEYDNTFQITDPLCRESTSTTKGSEDVFVVEWDASSLIWHLSNDLCQFFFYLQKTSHISPLLVSSFEETQPQNVENVLLYVNNAIYPNVIVYYYKTDVVTIQNWIGTFIFCCLWMSGTPVEPLWVQDSFSEPIDDPTKSDHPIRQRFIKFMALKWWLMSVYIFIVRELEYSYNGCGVFLELKLRL